MWLQNILIFSFCLLCGSSLSSSTQFDFTNLTGFPEDFFFSVATASYQVEGAWNVSGRGEGMWDRLLHTQNFRVKDGSNGDVACDSYHKYKEDVQNIKAIGFNMHRFSLSWPRLFPTGYTSTVNPDGVRFYNDYIDELRANGIEPLVTLYHWDLPQPLAEIGGWLNPDIADIFGEYARAVFKLFGDKVKWWVTINEPESIVQGYGGTQFAPCLNLHAVGEYQAAHNLLRAHGKAYRIYDKEFRETQKGKLSIVKNGEFFTPRIPSDPSHVEAAERGNQFFPGWFLHPIYHGDYPPVMREYVDRNSKAEGLSESRLPHFTKEEIEEIKGSHDFLATNFYSIQNVEPGIIGHKPSHVRDTEITGSQLPGAIQAACKWVWTTPTGFRPYLNWLRKEYGDHEILITENGFCDNGEIMDYDRINFISEYLRNLLAAIKEDGVKVIGYTTWSLIDTFEWLDGYTSPFGLIKVDFDSPERTRTWKLSAKFIQEFIRRNTNTDTDTTGRIKFRSQIPFCS